MEVWVTTKPVVYSCTQKHRHFPLCLPQQYRKSFIFREELVASKYCAQTVGGCPRIYHTILRGWGREVGWKSYVSFLFHRREMWWRHQTGSKDWESVLMLDCCVMATYSLSEATLMWDSDTENPPILSSSTVHPLTPQHINSSPWLVQAPGPALPLLISLCLARRPHLPFLVFQSPKQVGPS